MLELRRCSFTVTGCFGPVETIDRLAESTRLAIRVAKDEILCLSDSSASAPDADMPNGVVIDLTSGYSIWSLTGGSRNEAFRRLSAIPLPAAGTIQGLVAQVPAKVVVLPDSLLIVVPSVVSHHFRERVLTACADLSVLESKPTRVGEPAPA